MSDLYGVLEVDKRASTEVIDAAYKALMRKHHPDRKDTVGRVARKLNEARDIPSDSVKRAEYDEKFAVGEGTIIGDWLIEEPIGEGGFGRTYKGSHVIVKEPVCIKHCSKIAGSRMLLSIVSEPVPSLADMSQLAWLYDIGYRNFMLCDELCLCGDLLGTAVNVFSAFSSSYAGH